MKELLEKGADIRNVALLVMPREEDDVDDEYDHNPPRIPYTHPDIINYVLIAGCVYGCKYIVKTALEKGANINYRNPRCDDTPLLVAIRNTQVPFIRYLIEAGANIYTVNTQGESIWDFSSEDNMELFQLLLEQTQPLWKLAFNNKHMRSIVRIQALWRGRRVRNDEHRLTTPTPTPQTVLLPVLCDASHCDKVGAFMCGNCKDTYYCSQSCQKSQYKHHKSVCVSPALAIGSP